MSDVLFKRIYTDHEDVVFAGLPYVLVYQLQLLSRCDFYWICLSKIKKSINI